MKKLIAIVLCLVMALSMAACGQDVNPVEDPIKSQETNVVQNEIKAETAKVSKVFNKVTEPAKEDTKETTEEPAKEVSKEPTKESAKEPAKESSKAPAEVPAEPVACEHQWGVDQVNDGRILYRCELCDAVKDEVDPNYKAEDPANCEHRWECYGEGETGMFLYECIDCGALDVEYKCPHEFCTEEHLTDNGKSYIRYTCISCGHTYSSDPVEVPAEEPVEEPTEAPKDPANCEHRWKRYGEGETGMFLNECMDCGALDLEYKCPHEFCMKKQLTNPDDGSVYTQNTCLSCGYIYNS